MYQVDGRDQPGLDLRIPMPPGADARWSVKIKWDMATINEQVAITSRTRGVRMDKSDSQVRLLDALFTDYMAKSAILLSGGNYIFWHWCSKWSLIQLQLQTGY